MLSQPLEIVTGLPGASKTLHTIQHVEELRKSSGREVFYSGIAELTLPWTEIDPKEWMKTPPGSLIVIDEAQRVFRPSAITKDPQPWITELETIRHGGRNMVLITQHPNLLHTNVRKLAGKHFHIIRALGSHNAVMHEFDGVRESVNKSASRRDSVKHVLRFPKEVFGWYKSAEVHTVKRRLPKRLIFMIVGPIVAIVGGVIGIRMLLHPNGASTPAAQSATAPGAVANPNASGGPHALMSYQQLHTARYAGLPQTAPVYDDLMKPTIAPKPTSCVASATRCSCYTQQGTKIPSMPDITCRSIVANGFFDDAPDKRESTAQPFFERQARNADLVQAPKERSRVGADEEARAAPLPVVARTWVEPRQTVTPRPDQTASNGGPSTNPKFGGGG